MLEPETVKILGAFKDSDYREFLIITARTKYKFLLGLANKTIACYIHVVLGNYS